MSAARLRLAGLERRSPERFERSAAIERLERLELPLLLEPHASRLPMQLSTKDLSPLAGFASRKRLEPDREGWRHSSGEEGKVSLSAKIRKPRPSHAVT